MAVGSITLYNLNIAIRRSRDSQRKSDLGSISDALHKYQADFGFFPPSENGKIKACKNDLFNDISAELKESKRLDTSKFFEGERPCEWGADKFVDLFDERYPAYLLVIPQDPKAGEGANYLYFSNTNRFQLYSYLEGGGSEDGYDTGIVGRNLSCGRGICSFGKSYGETPLDKSIEDYEEELVRQQKGGK